MSHVVPLAPRYPQLVHPTPPSSATATPGYQLVMLPAYGIAGFWSREIDGRPRTATEDEDPTVVTNILEQV